MISSYTAHTFEIDDFDLAASEIKQQLNLDKNMKKNTIGIVACNYEFALAGTIEAICAELPFDVIGSISTVQGITKEEGQGTIIFTIMMLTSDDIEFKTGLSEPLSDEDYANQVKAFYKSLAQNKNNKKVSLAFPIAPFIMTKSGDTYVKSLSEVAPGVPLFGTIAVDDTLDFSNTYSIYNGKHYRNQMAMALFFGEINPKFYIATISQDKILNQSALITKSMGQVLQEVNDKPVIEFFEKLNLGKAVQNQYAMTSLPFVLDYNDGTPLVSKVFIKMDENNNAICAGEMPEGATLYVGMFEKDDVLLTSGNAIKRAVEENQDKSKPQTVIIYSCVSRHMSLAGDVFAEINKIREVLIGANDKSEFMLVYSGGEIGPTKITADNVTNRFHNNAFIACVL